MRVASRKPRRAKRHPTSHSHVECPFCGMACSKSSPMSWCAGCFVEYRIGPRGGVIFDPGQRTERFAYAKAFMKAGGVAIGRTPTDTEDL